MPRTKNKQNKLHVKKGDMVMLLKNITSAKSLNEDKFKGYVGKVLRVYPKTQRIIVEGVNLRYKHRKPSPAFPQGGRMPQEIPIHASNVLPVDSNGDATRVGRKWIEDPETGRGHWIRYAKTTGEELD